MRKNNQVMTRQILIVLGFLTVILFVVVLNVVLQPSSMSPSATAIPSFPHVIVEIASSNTKQNWMDAVAAKFNAAEIKNESGEQIIVNVAHVTSGGSQREILEGQLKPTVWSPGDSSWVDTANELWRDRNSTLLISDACPQSVFAPIGIAMWRPMAEALGWPETPIGWTEIISLASSPEGWASVGHPEWGSFKFGHTHPDYSNVGLLVMTSLAYYETGKTAGMAAEEVYSDQVQDAFRHLEINTYHYGRQSRDLLALMVNRGPQYLHGVTTSEAETLKHNELYAGELRFPLVFVFPSDGVYWGEHPYCILDAEWVSDSQKEAAAVFRDYLLASEQQAMAVDNYLRPVDTTIEFHAPIALENGTDPNVTTDLVPSLESPSSAVAQAVKDVFHNTKKPATVVLVIDSSGSMGGDKIKNAVVSAQNFVRRLDGKDEIFVVGFNDATYAVGDGGTVSEVSEGLISSIGAIISDGGTALFDATCEATRMVENLRSEHEANDAPHLYGIVVLSDGEDTSSNNRENQMINTCLPTGETADGVKVFTIAYGEGADEDLMTRIANRTNAKSYEGTPENIERIYEDIIAQ